MQRRHTAAQIRADELWHERMMDIVMQEREDGPDNVTGIRQVMRGFDRLPRKLRNIINEHGPSAPDWVNEKLEEAAFGRQYQ